jgi:transposase-like protein
MAMSRFALVYAQPKIFQLGRDGRIFQHNGLQHVAKKWTQPIREWKAALNQFVILFGERVPA